MKKKLAAGLLLAAIVSLIAFSNAYAHEDCDGYQCGYQCGTDAHFDAMVNIAIQSEIERRRNEIITNMQDEDNSAVVSICDITQNSHCCTDSNHYKSNAYTKAIFEWGTIYAHHLILPERMYESYELESDKALIQASAILYSLAGFPCSWEPTHNMGGTCGQRCPNCGRTRIAPCTMVHGNGYSRCRICGLTMFQFIQYPIALKE